MPPSTRFEYSTSDVAVTIRLLEAIVIAAYTRNNKGPRGAAARHDLARQPRVGRSELIDVESRYQAVRGTTKDE